MTVQHVFSSPFAEDTGTVTVFNSAGVSVTEPATSLIGANEWNSAHNQTITLTGNTAGSSTVSGTNILFSGGIGITLSGTGSTINIEAPPLSISAYAVPWFFAGPLSYASAGQIVAAPGSSAIFGCIIAELPITMTQVGVPVFFSIGSTSSTNTAHFTHAVGLYTLTAGTYTLQASSTLSIGLSQSSTSFSFTVSGGAGSTSYTTVSAGTMTGQKWIQIPFAQSVAAAVPALLAYSSSEAGALFSCSLLPYALGNPIGVINITGAGGQFTSSTGYDRILGGVFSVTSAAFPASEAPASLSAPPGYALIAQMVAS
jgi:hypothetical protein